MSELLLVPIAVISLAIGALLFVYGINFFYLTYLAWRTRPQPALPALTAFPNVTVQLPIYNEMYVAERLINAVANFDYPADKLEIHVLDDSTDETREIVQRAVMRWSAQGLNIRHLHRIERTGFKAGALAAGLRAAHGEFIAYFDSDFVPPTDFLKKTLPAFADSQVAFVQTRWGHLNADYSLLTFLQSLAIDAHFVIEQSARSHGGFWFNFNGTAGVWRRTAMLDAGGWLADTLTEDLDLSYRAFLKGWKAVYLGEVVTPAELPVTFGAYRRQQHRWAKGSFECALKLLPRIWRAPLSTCRKIEATLHLTGYGIHLLMFALALTYPFVLYLSQQYPALLTLFGISLIFNLTAFAPTVYFTLAQKQLGRQWWERIPAILFITALGAGMVMNTLHAAYEILIGQGKNFERTPKFGIARRDQTWQERRYQSSPEPLVWIELLFGIWNLVALVYALELRNWIIAIYCALFLGGILFVTGTTLIQSLELRWHQKHDTFSSAPSRASD